MQHAYIKPANGLQVRLPATGEVLPDKGRRVALTTYWRRRIADGSVVIKPSTKRQSQSNKTPTDKGAKTS